LPNAIEKTIRIADAYGLPAHAPDCFASDRLAVSTARAHDDDSWTAEEVQ